MRQTIGLRLMARAALCAVAASVTSTTLYSVQSARADESPPRAPSVGSTQPSESSGSAEESPAPTDSTRSDPVYLPRNDESSAVLVYPPDDRTAPRPMAVMLHGMCNRPEYECPHFARAITQHAWLVCPRATVTCKSGGAIWSFRDRTRSIEAAVERVKREFAGEIDESQGRTLMGFSLGAITAMALAHDASGQWRRVILIGAKTDPRPSELKKAGVERMLFVSGDYDMMRSNMVEQSRRVARAGIASTFMSLGRVGHRFPSDMEEQMARAYAWVSGPSETTEPSR